MTIMCAMEELLAENARLVDLNNQLQRENSELRTIAYHDALTGVGNRRSIDTHADSTSRKWVYMFDINGLKLANDLGGHAKGDALIRKVSQTICGLFRRSSDIIGRFGGDEFIVMSDSDFPPEKLDSEDYCWGRGMWENYSFQVALEDADRAMLAQKELKKVGR
jgi:GGDEF domain-containing protein